MYSVKREESSLENVIVHLIASFTTVAAPFVLHDSPLTTKNPSDGLDSNMLLRSF